MTILVGRVSSTGSVDRQGPRVTEKWQIIDTDNNACNLGPIACMLNPDVPKFGMPYNPDGCDANYLGLRVNRVVPGDLRKDEVKGECWREITVEYGIDSSTPNGGRPGLPNFNKPDPITWVPSVEVNDNPRRVVAERLLFIGAVFESDLLILADPCLPDITVPIGIYNSVVERPSNTIAPVASTAGEPFNPPEEIDSYDTQYRITVYVEDWDPDDAYDCFRGSVNSGEVHLQVSALNFDKVCARHTLKMRSITGRPGYREWRDNTGALVSRQYWSVTMDILYRRAGWYIDKLNVGTKRILKGEGVVGLDDGNGGTFNNSTDFPAGTSHIGDILDRGRPVDRPQWLDMQGQPIPEKNTGSRRVLRYLDGYEKNWLDSQLGLPLAPTP